MARIYKATDERVKPDDFVPGSACYDLRLGER